MTKKTSPRPERNYDAERKVVEATKAVERAKSKMDVAKKAVGWAKSLAEKYPKSETFASALTAIDGYIEATDRYADSVRKRAKAGTENNNAVCGYYESLANYKYRQGRKFAKAKNRT